MLTRLIALSACVVLAGIGSGAFPAPSRGNSAQEDVARHQAFARGGFKEAAAVTGAFVMRRGEFAGSPVNLGQALAHSHRVLVGKVVSAKSYENLVLKTIFTSFDVSVSDMMKSTPGAPNHVSVIVPGGRLGFEGGSWGQVIMEDYRPPLLDHEYVFFLREARQEILHGAGPMDTPFEPTFGALGIVEISREGPVRTAGGSATQYGRWFAGRRFTRETLLDAVQALLRDNK